MLHRKIRGNRDVVNDMRIEIWSEDIWTEKFSAPAADELADAFASLKR